MPRSEFLNVRKKSPDAGELVVTTGRVRPVIANKSPWKTFAVSLSCAAWGESTAIREAEPIVNDPKLPCHSRRLGMTFGAALGTRLAESANRKGRRFVKVMTMPTSIVMQNAMVLFLKGRAPY